jgi:hypothetical protein
MSTKLIEPDACKARSLARGRRALLTALISVLGTTAAGAYVGDSFLRVPGVKGDWPGGEYKQWVRVSANYWKGQDGPLLARSMRSPRQQFSGPQAPTGGASALMISVDKHSPVLAELMERCQNKTVMPEMTYAESSQLSRNYRQLGPRPDAIPEYFEYQLKDAQFTSCPVVDGAADQAFIVSFNDIKWINYHGSADGEKLALVPSKVALEVSNPVRPAKFSGTTKSFVVSWIAFANEVGDDQCEKMNSKPVEDDYYALMSKEAADEARAANAKTGGINYENGQMDHRGPEGLNACLLPGITRNPGMIEPHTTARGLDLEHTHGMRKLAGGICKHQNFFSEDGRTVVNQLYRAQGCVAGYLGHKGFLMQYTNEQRRNGLVSILIQISGIHDEKNNADLDVKLLYSLDHMAKDASGKQILPDYTFRLTDNPEYTHYFVETHARMSDGVILTDPIPKMQLNMGIDAEVTFADAQLRLQIMPDGTLKGVLGGYQDWRRVMGIESNSVAESYYGFQCPAIYAALKREADGMKDPVSGECNGISSAYDIEGVPAFIAAPEHPISPALPSVAKSGDQRRQTAAPK